MASPTTWYIQKDGRTHGPYTPAQLRQLVERGAIVAETLVSPDGQRWKPAGEVRGLLPAVPVAPVVVPVVELMDEDEPAVPISLSVNAETGEVSANVDASEVVGSVLSRATGGRLRKLPPGVKVNVGVDGGGLTGGVEVDPTRMAWGIWRQFGTLGAAALAGGGERLASSV